MAVYVIQARPSGLVKIGHGRNPRTRLGALKINRVETLTLLHVFEGGREEERALHDRFRKHRVSGEWFEGIPEIVGGDFGLPVAANAEEMKRPHGEWTAEAHASKRDKHEARWSNPEWVMRRMAIYRRTYSIRRIESLQRSAGDKKNPAAALAAATEIMALCDVGPEMVMEPVLRDWYTDIQERLGFPKPVPLHVRVLAGDEAAA